MNPVIATPATPTQQFAEKMVMLVAVLGTGMVYLDQTALNVALPSLQIALNADIGGVQWLIDIYILTLATLLLIGGVLGDHYGRVRVYLIGMFIFVAASIACGVAQTLGFLLAARAIQGLGGALLVPGGLALINATVAGERRGGMIGTWATLTSLVIAFGPSLGGFLVDTLSWRLVFFINVPLGIIAALVGLWYVPESRDELSSRGLDWPGVVALLVGLGGLLFGLIEGPQLGWTDPLIITVLIVGVVGLVAFVGIEARSPAPMIPLHLFRNRNFSGINLVTVIHWLALSSVFFFLTLNLQQVQGYSATQAGLAVLPISVLIVSLSGFAGKLTDRIGPLPLLTSGLLLTIGGFLLFMRPGVAANYWTTFFPATVVFGLGLAITVVPVTATAMGALPRRYSGIASGLNNAAARIAQMLAVAIFGSVMLVSFRLALADYTASLPLEPATRTALLAEARNLGATRPPAGLSSEITQTIDHAIKLAFVDSFRQVMLISIILTLISLLIILTTIRFDPDQQDDDSRTS